MSIFMDVNMFVDFRSGIANQTLVHNNHGFSQILKSDNISLRQAKLSLLMIMKFVEILVIWEVNLIKTMPRLI
jgi:hypothetical protein